MFCVESGAVLSCQDLVVGDAFAVGHELPCSDTRKALNHLLGRYIPWCSGSCLSRIDL